MLTSGQIGEVQVVARERETPAWVLYEDQRGFHFVGPMALPDAYLVYDRLVALRSYRDRQAAS